METGPSPTVEGVCGFARPLQRARTDGGEWRRPAQPPSEALSLLACARLSQTDPRDPQLAKSL
jgi:hypothetical protein